MSAELLRTIKQLGINTKLMSTCKAINHNINQLITGTRMYKEKNIALGFSLIFPSIFFLKWWILVSPFLCLLLIDYFNINKTSMNESVSQ